MPPGKYPRTPEHKAKIAASLKGHDVPEETREKIRKSVLAAYERPEVKAKNVEVNRRNASRKRGENGSNWKGDDVGYGGMHQRARKALPLVCSHADETCRGVLEIALRADAPSDFLRTGPCFGHEEVTWSIRIEDYIVLCRSHHRRYDGVEPSRQGRRSAPRR